MIAVSRCLIGENCTYAGKNNLCKEIKELYDQGLALPLCPEVLGGYQFLEHLVKLLEKK